MPGLFPHEADIRQIIGSNKKRGNMSLIPFCLWILSFSSAWTCRNIVLPFWCPFLLPRYSWQICSAIGQTLVIYLHCQIFRICHLFCLLDNNTFSPRQISVIYILELILDLFLCQMMPIVKKNHIRPFGITNCRYILPRGTVFNI